MTRLVPGTITHKPSYHRMQRMPSILANPPRSIEISNRGSPWRTCVPPFSIFFFPFLPLLRQPRRKQEGWRTEVEREEGSGINLLPRSLEEAATEEARGLSEKKERVKNTFARDFLWVEGRGGGRALHVWMKLFRWRKRRRATKKIDTPESRPRRNFLRIFRASWK